MNGRIIPKGSEELRIVLRQLEDLNRERLNRARAEGRTRFALLGVEHVYRDPNTGQLVPASEAPRRAFVDGWELVGHRVHEQDRPVGNFDRAIRDGARRSRVQQVRATTVTRATGRAPREARNDRHRGSRRTTGSGSTSSGEDDPEPEPPGARPCAECGQPVEPNSRGRPREYCKDCSTPAARKCRERENDRRHPERVVEREGEIWSLAPECSCGSEAAAPDYVLGYYRCVPCGLKRPEPEAHLLDYRAGEDRLRARSFVPAHGLKKRNPRFGDYKRKPVTHKKRLSSGQVVPV